MDPRLRTYGLVKLGLGLKYGVSEFLGAKSPKCFHMNVDVEQKYKYLLRPKKGCTCAESFPNLVMDM